MMTVNNMAKHAMLNGMYGGTNPLLGGANSMFGSQKTSAATPFATQSPFGPGLQAGTKPGFTTSTAVRESGKDLLGAIDDRKTASSQYQGTSSNDKTASVTVDNSKATSASISSMQSNPAKLDVKQTALAQSNEGDAMSASGNAVKAGEYSFSIEAGGKTHEFTIDVKEGDSNADIQEKMAAAINEKDIGVSASVSSTKATDDKEATTSLSITADKTGTDSEFTVKDVSGNLASSMGVADATQKAQNAVYSVNGGAERTSQSNDVSIADGVTATLKSSGTTSVSVERDAKSAVEGVKGLVDSLNSALKSASVEDGRGSSRFVSDIQAMNKNYSASLSRVGISVSSTGELSIDEKKLEKAAQDGSLDRLFADQRFGFGARMDRIANNAVNSELYANAQVNFSFDRGQLMFFNMHNSGLLFNLLI